ncbi:MAG: recombinase family protein [Oligoflexia bacterium]|nr:recombinase family protein [Oligoflexia bacterium]
MSNKPDKHIALYCRTSTDKQDSGLESQRRALIKYCDDNGILNYRCYEDAGISGTKGLRPELDKLMEDVRGNTVEAVIVYSFSRFARSTQHLLAALTEFQASGVAFISLSAKIETNSAIGKAVFVIIAAIATLERDLIAERVKNGLINAKAKGAELGRPRSRQSLLIQNLAAQGLSYRKIAELAGCSAATVHRELKESYFNGKDSSKDAA